MSAIVLSASVRQNLLSLQSTADLLSTTQNRLATGNKVNSALDNPTSFFTAQALNNRASDINNLLDGIGNGVQVLQAANTGITSLQKLVDTAKSIAQQVLQAPTGYSTKSSVTSGAITGGTAANLLGTGLAQGDVLTIAATGGGTASSITFGTGADEVDTLTELNAALAGNNLQASVDDTTGEITITTTNDAASATIGALGGTATGAGKAFLAASVTTVAKVADACLSDDACEFGGSVQQHHRADHHHGAGCVLQRHQPAERRQAQADLQRDRQVHAQHHRRDLQRDGSRPCLVGRRYGLPGQRCRRTRSIATLGSASSALRSQASALGSNLSIVQIRQDFSKNLINVLQTGSSNLTLADTNEEAANSQALSTRQSIAVSALALANQSQQSVLQLLR